MSGATSPASYSTGGNPASYIPTAQPAGDTSYQGLLGFGSGAGGGFGPAAGQVPSVNPAYQAYQQATSLYPQAGNAYGTYVDNLGLSNAAIGGAEGGANIFNSQVYPQLAGAPATLAGGANQLAGTIPQLLNTGFDPQSALYNQLSGQSRDAANVANAGAGIGGTPYGASVAANAQNNFNLNWQAQQLARQQQATQAAGSALGSAGSGFTNAGNIGTGLAQGSSSFNQLPYQTSLGIGNNQISGLGNLQSMLQGQANLGGQSFVLPQQVLNDLQSYLQLGQSAQAQGLTGGQMGVNQLASGIGGGIGAANTFLNPNSGIFPNAVSGIGSGIGNLFGGGGGAGADFFGGTTGTGEEISSAVPALAGS